MELDLIFSIGPACRPAYHLKQNFLRLFSCPLDWQMNYSLSSCLHLFQTSFKTFFTEIHENTERKGAHGNRYIVDVQNSITSIHHFDSAPPLEEAHARFLAVMQKRFHTLHEAVLHSHTVGLICNRQDSIEDLASFLQSFGKIYENTRFILINIRDDRLLTSVTEKIYTINPRLQIREYSFCDQYQRMETAPENEWLGNTEIWSDILQEYTLSNHPITQYIKSRNKPVFIYGAGVYCLKLKHLLEKNHIMPAFIVVTHQDANPSCIEGTPVISYSTLLSYAAGDSAITTGHNSSCGAGNQPILHETPAVCNDPLIIISVIDQTVSQEIYRLLKSDGFQSVIRFNSSLRPIY